ncbi:NUDIX domain-containing protein [Cellulomonas sp. URHE0023]|uniref:NUDIX domain-containing protein n=1 Tax=Cellulomonas sp. URHE0023 TaxID=1380354 RepID=UPI00047FB78A|nr:NUDIX domain-containing protein [Cellulomonas sp. URHE0023]
MTPPSSAGLLLFRRSDVSGLQVLIAHMGGPFWARKDAGAWTIPKGEPSPDEDPHAAALREFEEELGSPPPPADVPDLTLGTVRQKSGKVVTAWAREGDFDAASATSNTVEIEWPPRSGRRIQVPEIDRVGWFAPAEAAALVVLGQGELIQRLVALLEPEARSV